MQALIKSSTLIAILLISFVSFGQFETRMPISNTAHVFGKVFDSTGETVPFATVIVLKSETDPTTGVAKEVLVTGTTTEGNGEFSIEDLEMTAGYKLQISYIGFDNHDIPLTFQRGKTEYDLGKITMSEGAQQLDEITVTAIVSAMKMDVDKRVFNVGANSIAAGGTGEDVLRNVPSINVDIDGGITLRNAPPQIFLDGRPTTLTPDQIPADAIESIEVITNPSAKYDASGGGAGILNIILKKNKKTGYNGSVRVGAESIGGGNTGLELNLRQNKFNIFGSFNGRLNKRIGTSELSRTNFSEGVPSLFTTQSSRDEQSGSNLMGRLGFDYLISNKSSITLSGMTSYGSFDPLSRQSIFTDNLFDTEGAIFSERISSGGRAFKNQGLTFGFKHLFSTDGDEISFDANYFSRSFENNSTMLTNLYQGGVGSPLDYTFSQKILGMSDNSTLVMQIDLTKNLGSSKLEAGLRANISGRDTENNNFNVNPITQGLELIYNPSSNFVHEDNVYAAYASVKNSYKNFGYQIGLRAESSSYNGKLTETGQEFSNSFPISLFPSIFLSQRLSESDDVQISYTRRVNRPNFFQLIPFADSTDRLDIRLGNANLLPEFTSSLEASYLKRFDSGNTLLGSVYYKHTDNLISGFLIDNGDGRLISTFVNANSAYSSGLEMTAQTYITKTFDINTNLNIYNSKINLDETSDVEGNPDALWSWFGKVNGNLKLKNNFTIQVSGLYQSKTNQAAGSGERQGFGGGAQSSAQGYIKAFYSVDAAVKKTFADNKMTLTLSMNDIFRTRFNAAYSENNFFIQDFSRINNPQVLRLNFAYNFGKVDSVIFKRKTKGTGEQIGE